MKTLFIGFVNDAVNPIMKGIAIRIAYLLSDQIRSAGNMSSYVVEENFIRNISIEQKLKFINQHEKDNPDAIAFYQKYKEFQKIYKKDRGRDKELIVLQKKTEKTINDVFNSLLVEITGFLKIAGLADFRNIEESSNYGEYYIRHKSAETREEDCYRLSDILQWNLDKEEDKNPPIFVLTDMYFKPEFNSGDDMPTLNMFSEKGFLQELFTFPNYNDFSIIDLNTIRFAVDKSREEFKQTVNVFVAMHSNPAEAFAYLQSNTVIAAKTLAESINNTGLVATYNKLTPAENNWGKFYLGMIPRHLVFKYFEYINASKEETIVVLQQLPDEYGQQLVPVFITRFDIERLAVQEEPSVEKAALIPLKKSLSID